MAAIYLGPWLPDQAAFEAMAAMEASGVVPTLKDYQPAQSFGAVASAITARAQGAFAMRDSAGNIHNVAGDATKLYHMAADGLSFDDASRLVGGAYATPAAGWVDFHRFGNHIIARNGVDATQMFDAGSSTDFAALSGSPPTAAFGMTVREFAVALRLSSSFTSLAWSALGDDEDWVPSVTTMSDTQEMPEGGPIMGGVGGEVGIIFQLERITRMVFEGPPTIFRFDPITELLGVRPGCERSIVAWEGLIFWIAQNGFHMMRGGAEIIPIGEGKIDEWFTENANAEYLYRITSAINPNKKVVVWSFPDTSSSDGTPNHQVFYHWPSGRWGHTPIANHELIYIGIAQTGYTLESLDTVSGSIDALNHSLDSLIWTGSGQPALAGFNASHQAGFFDGANLAATLDTGEAQLAEGRMALLRSLSPLVEGTSVAGMQITIKGRNMLHEAVTAGTPGDVNANGVAPLRDNWRYHRASLSIPAGRTWKHAIGVADPVFSIGSRYP